MKSSLREEFADSFSLSRAFFYILGLFPFPDISLKWRLLTDLWFWISYVNLTICAIQEFITIIYGFATQQKNFVENVAMVPLVSYTIIGLQQIINVYKKRQQIIQLVVDLRELFLRHSMDDLVRYKYEESQKQNRKLQNWYAVSYITLIMTFNFISIGRSIVNYMADGRWFLELPYAVVYPFNARDQRIFMFAYMQQLWWGFTCIIGVLAINLLLGTITDQLCFEFHALATNLRAMQLKRRNGAENVALIRRLVGQHNDIIRLAEEFGRIISFTLLMNFLLISVVMCTVGFQVIATDSVSESLKFLLFLMVCLLQTLSLSYFGNCIIESVGSSAATCCGQNLFQNLFYEILLLPLSTTFFYIVCHDNGDDMQSLSIGDSVYESDWLNGDLTSKKFLLFIILRSRRPVCLRAESFSIVSLQSFGSVRVAIIFYRHHLLLLHFLRPGLFYGTQLQHKIWFICRFLVPATHISRYYGKCTMGQPPSHHSPCNEEQC